MSDTMLFGVLRMPYELAMSDELSRRQFYGRAQQAAAEIESLRAERDALQARIDEAPTIIYGQSAVAGGMPYSLNGKRVALVTLD